MTCIGAVILRVPPKDQHNYEIASTPRRSFRSILNTPANIKSKREMHNATYILTNPNRKVLYTGVTNNLPKRLVEHYQERGNPDTFAGKYYCYCLIWYDVFPTMYEAIQAEKRIKGKKRSWKEQLIAGKNPEWKFLNEIVLGEWPPRQTIVKS